MAVHSRFTRIPKVHDLILAGVPTEVIPTYCALADYSNNKTGLCWPRMETLARRLSRSPRTIQRHLHLLKEKGLIEFVERKRDWHGRFGAYLYRVVHIAAAAARKGAAAAATTSTSKTKSKSKSRGRRRKKHSTTGHTGLVAPIKELTKHNEGPPIPPNNDPKDGYWFLFGENPPPGAQQKYLLEAQHRREEEARRRREGYEWVFE